MSLRRKTIRMFQLKELVDSKTMKSTSPDFVYKMEPYAASMNGGHEIAMAIGIG